MIDVQLVGPVLVATLRNPPVNALDVDMAAQLASLTARVAATPEVRVLHIRSEEKAFSAGGDIRYLDERITRSDGPELVVSELLKPLHAALADLERLDAITIAEIGGHALGGGLELALACDLRVASRTAKLGLVEVHLGLIAGAGGTQRLTQLCGPGTASRMILTGDTVTGAEAERIGLVQWALEPEEVADFAHKLAARCATYAPQSVRASKRCIAAALPSLDKGFALELAHSRDLYGDVEVQGLLKRFISARAGS